MPCEVVKYTCLKMSEGCVLTWFSFNGNMCKSGTWLRSPQKETHMPVRPVACGCSHLFSLLETHHCWLCITTLLCVMNSRVLCCMFMTCCFCPPVLFSLHALFVAVGSEAFRPKAWSSVQRGPLVKHVRSFALPRVQCQVTGSLWLRTTTVSQPVPICLYGHVDVCLRQLLYLLEDVVEGIVCFISLGFIVSVYLDAQAVVSCLHEAASYINFLLPFGSLVFLLKKCALMLRVCRLAVETEITSLYCCGGIFMSFQTWQSTESHVNFSMLTLQASQTSSSIPRGRSVFWNPLSCVLEATWHFVEALLFYFGPNVICLLW